ncbi:sarcosine oxidase subunit delta [bacterium MnTg02]|nr:sarcosine oxidase subunit delta [bacterium MnTg02]
MKVEQAPRLATIEGIAMRIKCPWCGDRPLDEFSYSGDATVRRPDEASAADPAVWQDYVYLRDNPTGRHIEYWQHAGGCRSWLIVERNITTHEIHTVSLANPQQRESE